MLRGKQIAQEIRKELISSNLETALQRVVENFIQYLPDHLRDDPEEVSSLLSAAQYYAAQAHPEFVSGASVHDIVLLRLIPKPKTKRYIDRLKEEAED